MKAISLSLATLVFAHCSGSFAAAGVPGSGTWTEAWPDESGQLQTGTVTAGVWTETFQADLDADGQLHIPDRGKPYYLDGPLVMKSGRTLTADAKAEIRLKPGSDTGMVRNEQVASLNGRPVPADQPLDRDITIEGGIWRTLAVSHAESNGNLRGASSRQNAVFGTHGVILLQNVRGVPVKNITIRQSRPFGVHLANAREFRLYDQPNLEMGRDKDFSVGIGTLKNLLFENLTFHRPGKIEVHANTDGLTVRDVKLLFSPARDHHLVEFGPKSMTYKGAPGTDPSRWTEIFSPDLDCTVRNLDITGVRTRDSQADLPIEQVVKVIELKPNPDYPKTTPKGGTGKGIWIR